MPRFVILRHDTPVGHSRASHWDLMLEQGSVLKTWALADVPRSGVTLDAEQLPDHRLAYLDYEGPVSGNRGTVARWDRGDYEIQTADPTRLKIRLAGTRLAGHLELCAEAGDTHRWTGRFSAD